MTDSLWFLFVVLCCEISVVLLSETKSVVCLKTLLSGTPVCLSALCFLFSLQEIKVLIHQRWLSLLVTCLGFLISKGLCANKVAGAVESIRIWTGTRFSLFWFCTPTCSNLESHHVKRLVLCVFVKTGSHRLAVSRLSV